MGMDFVMFAVAVLVVGGFLYVAYSRGWGPFKKDDDNGNNGPIVDNPSGNDNRDKTIGE